MTRITYNECSFLLLMKKKNIDHPVNFNIESMGTQAPYSNLYTFES